MPRPYVPFDRWAKRAKEEGFLARSVYKLQELDERFHLFAAGMRVLDMGAAPGSWLQYASQRVGAAGHVLGLDLKDIGHVALNVTTVVCDALDAAAVERAILAMKWEKVDLVVSDMAPSTSGIKDVDQWKSVQLNDAVLKLANRWLKRRGALVMKVFRGRNFDGFLREVKRVFPRVKTVTVRASRDRSREVYLVCQR